MNHMSRKLQCVDVLWFRSSWFETVRLMFVVLAAAVGEEAVEGELEGEAALAAFLSTSRLNLQTLTKKSRSRLQSRRVSLREPIMRTSTMPYAVRVISSLDHDPSSRPVLLLNLCPLYSMMSFLDV